MKNTHTETRPYGYYSNPQGSHYEIATEKEFDEDVRQTLASVTEAYVYEMGAKKAAEKAAEEVSGAFFTYEEYQEEIS